MKSTPDTHSFAERLAKRRKPPVLVALDTFPDQYLVSEARRRGWQLFYIYLLGPYVRPNLLFQGALLNGLPSNEFGRDLQDQGCRIVLLGREPHPCDDPLPAVLPDEDAYGRRGAEHFHQRRFKNVAFVGRDPWAGSERLYGAFKSRAEELGMGCHLLQFKEGGEFDLYTPQKRYLHRQAQFSEWLRQLPLPVGLLAQGDGLASGLCFMISQAGKDVPTDVAVLGKGDCIEICRGAMTPISSFGDCRKDQVHAACDLLERLIAGEKPPRAPVLIPPPPIIERQSTRILAVGDPVVAQALRFIWDHFDLPMSVDDVAAEAGVCRSLLQRGFRKHLNRGINEELQRKRLEHCCKLLKTTGLSVDEIAANIGLRNGTYLHALFRKKFGITPRQYRQQVRHPGT